MPTGVDNTILAFVAIAALALAVQTIGMVAVLLVARKAARNLREEMEQYRSSIMPLILRARETVLNVAPKVELAAEELAAVSTKLREQATDIQSAANDILARTHTQAGRVDHMLTAVFDRMERAGAFMSDAVAKPMRQLSGVIASVKAVVETLRESNSRRHPGPPPGVPDYDGREPESAPRRMRTTPFRT